MASELLDEKAIFNVARQIGSPDGRAEYLRQACGTDSGLRERVQVLLHAYEEQASFLESPPAGPVVTIDHRASESAGTVIGPYKLIEQVGEGGMGSVWMAQQTEPVKRLVAVKLIRPGMDSRQVLARFEAERQALALMDHPNIAKVLDAGTTDTGRPYFVMDLVKGVPITRYCDDHRLTPRQRLELFVPVCQAVQHAHQKGIIHRDLKPSNVLVALYDGRPVPKVIDFGVAKAAGQPLTDRTLVTGFGAIVGTPEYMSPEQAEVNQLDIDTRSDVYSLGVLLYELLAGSPPFSRKDLEKAGMLEMLRVIREEEPSKPSTKLSTAEGLPTLAANRGTEPEKLTRLVRGELDWIVMKALEKDRNRRYETANGFAADVQRYLADEPVLACPPSAGYRLRKFARRNKGGLAVTALVLLFLVLLGSGIGWAVRDRSAREAEAARQMAGRQARAGGHIESIFAEVDRLEDEQKWPEALAAARRAEAVVAGGEADAETAERVRARLKILAFIDRLEQIRTERATPVDGEFDNVGADRKYAQAFRDYGVDVDALAVGASIDRLKTRPALAIPLAAALDDWVSARRFGGGQGTPDWQRVVAVARGLDPEPLRDGMRARWGQPTSPDSQADLRRLVASIDVRSHHPATLHQLTRTLQRAQLPDLGLEVLRRAQWRHPSDFWINFTLAAALKGMDPPHNDEAISFLRAALAVRPQSSAAHNHLGVALSRQKRPDEAIACFQKAIDLSPKYALAHFNLGVELAGKGQVDEAIACLRKAIEFDPKFVKAHYNLAKLLTIKGQVDEAIAYYRKAIGLDPKYVFAHFNLGLALQAKKNWDEAVAAYRKAIELDPKDAVPWYQRGLVYRDLRQPDKARADFAKAIELQPDHQDAWAERHQTYRGQFDRAVADYTKDIERRPDNALAWWCRAHAQAELKQYDRALADYTKAIELKPADGLLWMARAGFHARLGQNEKALADYTKAVELKPDDYRVWHARGEFHWRLEQREKALADFSRAIQLRPNDTTLLKRRARFYEVLKQWDKALADYSKAIEISPDDLNLWDARTWLYLRLNQPEKAVAEYSNAIERRPKDTELLVRRALLYTELKQWDKAVADWTVVVKRESWRGSGFAWLLVTCPDPKFRDPARAVEVAKKAVESHPDWGPRWTILGVAHYRAGDWKAAAAALDKAMELSKGGGINDWFFLAMSHWRLNDKAEARKWYDKAIEWMDKNAPDNEEMRRFRAEASELLGVVDRGRVEVAPLPHEKKK